MKYTILQRRANFYATGLRMPKKKVCSVSRFPVQRFTQTEIAGLIEDPDRFKARDQFGVQFCLDQGPLGQCNAVAACQALQRQFIKNGNHDCPRLSSNWLYSQINGGQDRGSMLDDGLKQIVKGVPPWRPEHQNKFRKRDFNKKDAEAAEDYKALECYGVDSELQLATGLALGFTAIVAVHVTNDWFNMDNDEIIVDCNGPGNHAVTVDDVAIHPTTGELLFDHMGSWGPNMHNGGRAWLTWRRHLTGPNSNHYFYLIRATDAVDDPEKELK